MKKQKEKTRKTKDGRKILISDMTDSHLSNAIKMMRGKSFISQKELFSYFSGPRPCGDMAQDAFDQELKTVAEKPVSKKLDWLKDEAKKRGLEH